MLLLANLKNEASKKDLCLAFAQGNHSDYPQNCKQIKKSNNPNNNNWGKKRDKSKKDVDAKSEDKDNNTQATAEAHVGGPNWTNIQQ